MTIAFRWGVQPWRLLGKVPHDGLYWEVGTPPLDAGRFRLYPPWRMDHEVGTRRVLAVHGGSAVRQYPVFITCRDRLTPLLALIAYPFIWLLLLPFRIVGVAVHGVLGIIFLAITLPFRLLAAPFRV